MHHDFRCVGVPLHTAGFHPPFTQTETMAFVTPDGLALGQLLIRPCSLGKTQKKTACFITLFVSRSSDPNYVQAEQSCVVVFFFFAACESPSHQHVGMLIASL